MEFQTHIKNGLEFQYSPTPISALSLTELREAIDSINRVSERIGCVVFEGRRLTTNNLVVFAGNLERFAMLSAARDTSARVFYFQDSINWWYGGSSLLPDIEGIARFVESFVGRRKCLAFGQSSGGYAALALGAFIPHCDVLACSPQAFSDRAAKQQLFISNSLAPQATPDGLHDIARMYESSERTGMAAAVFSASEFENPYRSHLWLDHLHMVKLMGVKTIDTYLADSANHSIVFQRAKIFAEFTAKLLAASGKPITKKRSIVREFVDSIQQNESL